MTAVWRERLAQWAKPPSETEEAKAERASRMVRDALRESGVLANRDFDIVAIGSTRNNTNVRAASDVDLAAVLRSAQYSELPASLTPEMLGQRPAEYGLDQFRRDVREALREKFGSPDVAPGKIALTIDASSARLTADVTPYLIHRRYTGARLVDGSWQSVTGIETRPADAPNRRIIQWPEQHYT